MNKIKTLIKRQKTKPRKSFEAGERDNMKSSARGLEAVEQADAPADVKTGRGGSGGAERRQAEEGRGGLLRPPWRCRTSHKLQACGHRAPSSQTRSLTLVCAFPSGVSRTPSSSSLLCLLWCLRPAVSDVAAVTC